MSLSGRILAGEVRRTESKELREDERKEGRKALGGINPPFYSLIP